MTGLAERCLRLVKDCYLLDHAYHHDEPTGCGIVDGEAHLGFDLGADTSLRHQRRTKNRAERPQEYLRGTGCEVTIK